MVALLFNFLGYLFQEGLHVLKTAYGTALEALVEQWERAKENAIGYQDALARGEIEWVGERDEDGYIIWDQDQVHEMEIDSKLEAQAALRKAFILALYHHWERSARLWTESNSRNHDQLVEAVEALGLAVDPKLGAVRDLANTLKHNNDRWGTSLLSSWPTLFPAGFRRGTGRTDWYGAVEITEAHMTEAFNIVSSSGPTDKTEWASGHGLDR